MNLPGPDDSAFWQAIGAIGSLMLIGAITSVWKFYKEKDDKAEPKQILLDKATMADIRPLYDIATNLCRLLNEEERQTLEIKAIRELLQRQDEEREDMDRTKRIVAETLAAQKKPRAAPRRRSTRPAKPATI